MFEQKSLDKIDGDYFNMTPMWVEFDLLGMMRETLYFGAPPLMLFASHTFA